VLRVLSSLLFSLLLGGGDDVALPLPFTMFLLMLTSTSNQTKHGKEGNEEVERCEGACEEVVMVVETRKTKTGLWVGFFRLLPRREIPCGGEFLVLL
jgi:hypothetical protein